jgi:hypothetical protein
VNSEAIQKSAAAPTTRNATTSMPLMPLSIASLQMGDISPHIRHAEKTLTCALITFALSIFLNLVTKVINYQARFQSQILLFPILRFYTTRTVPKFFPFTCAEI